MYPGPKSNFGIFIDCESFLDIPRINMLLKTFARVLTFARDKRTMAENQFAASIVSIVKEPHQRF